MSRPVIFVAIISDTHSFLDPRIAELVKNSDIVIHAGDIGNESVLDALKPRSGQVYAVRGNNDHATLWPNQQSSRLDKIPQKASMELPGGQIAIEHGDKYYSHSPSHDLLRKAHPQARVIVYGHTHKLVIDDNKEPWVVNPGAAGNTRNRGGPSCLMLEASEQRWEIKSHKFSEAK